MSKYSGFALAFSFLLCFGANEITAQNYNHAFGIRGGVGATLTYKKFFGEHFAMELLAGRYNFDNWGASGMVLYHQELSQNGRLLWYFGGGPYVQPREGVNAFGLAGALGLDFYFESVPINLTLDFLPQLQFKEEAFCTLVVAWESGILLNIDQLGPPL